MTIAIRTRPKMPRITSIEMMMPHQFFPSPSSPANSCHHNNITTLLYCAGCSETGRRLHCIQFYRVFYRKMSRSSSIGRWVKQGKILAFYSHHDVTYSSEVIMDRTLVFRLSQKSRQNVAINDCEVKPAVNIVLKIVIETFLFIYLFIYRIRTVCSI